MVKAASTPATASAIQLSAWAIIVLTVIAGAATLLMPAPAGQSAGTFHGEFATSLMVVVLNLGAAALFLVSLGGFSAKLKLAYVAMCAAFVAQSIGFVQIPLLSIAGELGSAWVKQGWVVLPFLSSALLTYFGVRGFARLFGVRGWLTSISLTQAIVVAVAVLLTFMPHAPWHESEFSFDATIALEVISGLECTFAAMLAFQVSRQSSQLYKLPMQLLTAGLISEIASVLIQVPAAFLLTNGLDLTANGTAIAPQVVGGVILVWAAVAFHGVPSREQAALPSAVSEAGRTALDAVMSLASLVSAPAGIESSSETLRVITSNLQPGQAISPEDEDRLAQCYLAIESYLDKRELVRPQPVAAMRNRTELVYGEALTQSKFWQTVRQTPPGAGPALSSA